MGTKLLLADDSITIQKVVGIIFANEDYELIVVDNGNAALEKAREVRPDILLLDALMPGKNGYEVCEEVRRDPVLKDAPLLLLVGAFEPFDEDKARNCGADDYITKPFESQSLIDKVRVLVETGQSRASKAIPVVEELAPPDMQVRAEEPVAAPLAEEAPQAGTSANLFESFKGFLHIGGGAPRPEETAEEKIIAAEPEPVVAPLAEAVEPEAIIQLSSVDIVEASPEDDPWGLFSEEVVEGEPIQFGEVFDEKEDLELADTVEAIEPFALMDEDELSGDETAFAFGGDLAGEPEDIDTFGEESAFTTEMPGAIEPEEPAIERVDVSEYGGERISLGETAMASQPESTFAPEFPADSADQVPGEFADMLSGDEELPFAPNEEYVSVAEQATAVEEDAALQASLPGTATAPVTFTEEQVAEAISRISREIIERIAWDVVPDLAEAIIKEEIRKIKEGMTS